MNTLHARLKKAFPFVGVRSATEDDLFEFCSRRNIELVFSPQVSAGIYVMFAGEHFIFLNSRLVGLRLLHVAFHEIGHYLLHVPARRRYAAEFYQLHDRERTHCQAETVAALLLLPPSELHLVLRSPEVYGSDDLQTLIGRRLDLWNEYRI